MKEILEIIPYKGMRKTIGKKMMEAQTYPLTYDANDIDMTDLMELRKKVNEEKGVKVSLNDYIIKACAMAIQRVPMINACLFEDEKKIEVYKSVNISVMTASEKGLVAPVIKEAQDKTVFEIADEMKVLIAKANEGTLTMEDMSEGTVGLTNVGKLGTYLCIPLPQPPQPVIIGAGTVRKAPWVMPDDSIAARQIMTLQIGGDHRVVDGMPLGQFITAMKEILEAPECLID